MDDLLFEKAFLLDYLEALRGLEVTFVGVRCSLEIVNAREASRPGRFPGTATAHFDKVHAHCVYDVAVDTGSTTPRACAMRVIQAAGRPGTAFDRLRAAFEI